MLSGPRARAGASRLLPELAGPAVASPAAWSRRWAVGGPGPGPAALPLGARPQSFSGGLPEAEVEAEAPGRSASPGSAPAPAPAPLRGLRRRESGLAAAFGLAAASFALSGGPGLAPPAWAKPAATAPGAAKAFKGLPGPGGILYRDLLEGDGKAAAEGSAIKVNYKLNLATGNLVEEESGGKFTLGSGPVPPKKPDEYAGDKKASIKGWEVAFLGGEDMPAMKQGGIREVLVPPELAYGKTGVKCNLSANCPGGFAIPPDNSIKFVLELTNVK